MRERNKGWREKKLREDEIKNKGWKMLLYSVLFLTQKKQITTMSTNAEMAVMVF